MGCLGFGAIFSHLELQFFLVWNCKCIFERNIVPARPKMLFRVEKFQRGTNALREHCLGREIIPRRRIMMGSEKQGGQQQGGQQGGQQKPGQQNQTPGRQGGQQGGGQQGGQQGGQ